MGGGVGGAAPPAGGRGPLVGGHAGRSFAGGAGARAARQTPGAGAHAYATAARRLAVHRPAAMAAGMEGSMDAAAVEGPSRVAGVCERGQVAARV